MLAASHTTSYDFGIRLTLVADSRPLESCERKSVAANLCPAHASDAQLLLTTLTRFLFSSAAL